MQKVLPGSRVVFRASDFNAFVDAAEAHKQRKLASLASDQSTIQPTTILVRNDTGVAQDRFAVLGINGFLILPADNLVEFQSKIALLGVAPIAQDMEGVGELHTEDSFAVLAEPIPIGKIGRAWVHGVCPVQVLVEDEEHRYAKIVHDETGHLVSADSGPVVILWREAMDVTPIWAVVRWGSANSGRVAFPVTLEQVGGAQGDDTAVASWTYDVKDLLTDDELENAVDPTAAPHKWVRPALGQITPATFGYAHYQPDEVEGGRQLVLGWINEVPVVSACT